MQLLIYQGQNTYFSAQCSENTNNLTTFRPSIHFNLEAMFMKWPIKIDGMKIESVIRYHGMLICRS